MSSTDSSSMVSRQGRHLQRYSESGARIVAGTVVMSDDKSQVLVISSESHPDKWVLPKGGAEKDESIEQGALRETWEEAGAIGQLGDALGTFHEQREDPHRATEYHFFELKLQSLADEWPESFKRRRKWMSYADARKALLDNKRIQLVEALDASSIARS